MENNNEKSFMTVTPIEEGKVISTQTLNMETLDQNEPYPAFIESNTQAITFEELKQNVIPTFADGSLTLSHANIINAAMRAAKEVFGELTPVECRVSHRIQGRVPEAMLKSVDQLTDTDKTEFYQRMAFVCRVKGITRNVNGVEVNLVIGGTRSYSEDKLFGKPSPSHIRLCVGWFVRLCSNGCLTCSGNSGVLDCLTEADVYEKALELFMGFDYEKEDALKILQDLGETRISEETFCKIIGRLRLYQALPTSEQNELPKFILGDQAVNKIAQGYVSNPTFGRKAAGEDGTITLWQMLNLANEAVKQSAYINDWAERNQNCTDFVMGIRKAILGIDEEGYNWFLS